VALALHGLRRDVLPAADWALRVATAYGVPVQVTSVYRTVAEQQVLYRRYLAGQSKWPANPPGLSAHNYRLAFDSDTDPRYMSWWVAVRRLAGFHVPANDPIHAEVPGWMSIA